MKLMSSDKKWNLKCLVAAVVTTLVVFLFLNHFLNLQKQKLKADETLKSSVYGNLLWTEVDRELNSLLFISNGMASFISAYRDDLRPEKIKFILKDLWQRSKHVRNLGVAVGYKITYVYPEESNSQIIGKDFRDIPKQWPKVKQAVDSREGVFDGPVDLLQGGRGFIYRYPIYLDDEYWGIMSTVINTDEFLSAAFKNTPKNHQFAIRSYGSKTVFYGDPQLFADKNTYKQTSVVPNGKWEWAIKNHSNAFTDQFIVYQLLGFLFSLFCGAAVYRMIHAMRRLSEQAMLDSLTHLPNRRLLQDRMDIAYHSCNRSHKMMAVLIIDIDYFKKINDTYGHDFGDEVIKTVANGIKATLRDTDTVSRVGGDEFIVLLKEFKVLENVHSIAHKLTEVFASPWLVLDKEITIHLSIGVSVYDPENPVGIKELLKEADIALYDSKAQGRNRFNFYQK
ncbi:sensor domain-containing diguanylate cyclase [Methylotenera mobilis]|uniref:Diguanylate cyclase n=1 Tax=Methylotenera mobilis (strain JLW8 / ATCC BAA-1282 / DSM 17540) TaxID=583345 RepID=C6WYN1_METML|nr:diguanylate cyclase [Methylotenera mobilis]ACT47006.1 diguanylate cyclase [Methylotenera mobilis JLW8]